MNDVSTVASRYEGLKQWGWYLSQYAEWTTYLKTSEPVLVLEIGAFDGVSANLMLDLIFTHPESRLVAIDPFLPDPTTIEVGDSTKSHFLRNVVNGRHESQIRLIEDFSSEALPGLPRERFDFIYIDGSHMARDVLSDAVMSFPLLKKGGVLGFDDYQWGLESRPYARPKPAIDAFESVYGDGLELLFSNWQRFYRKK